MDTSACCAQAVAAFTDAMPMASWGRQTRFEPKSSLIAMKVDDRPPRMVWYGIGPVCACAWTDEGAES